MNIRILNANENDVGSLVEIYSSPDLYHNRDDASWFVKSYFEFHHIKLAKQGKRIIGVLFWNSVEEKHHGLANIQELWVDESFRRRGIGERLLRASIEDMKKHYAKYQYTLRKVLVTTGEHNKPARSLYGKIGFSRVALLPDLFSKGQNEILYILTLNP